MDKSREIIKFYRRLDRAAFMTDETQKYAECDGAFPIGYGQTISQPSLVCEMTILLEPEKTHKVLEIGTGSGYQTAYLSEFCGEVYTVERIPELSARAEKCLTAQGRRNIRYRVGDGSDGWPEFAPYDRIMVTAAAGILPVSLVEQLSPQGRMIIPLGDSGLQELTLVTKDKDGAVVTREILKVAFVEMKGKYGWTRP